MADDVLVPCIPKPSSNIVLTVHEKCFLIFHKEGFRVMNLSIEKWKNMKIIFKLPERYSTWQGSTTQIFSIHSLSQPPVIVWKQMPSSVGHLTTAFPSETTDNKYSLLMHCIKIKSRAKSLLNEQYVFVGGNIYFLLCYHVVPKT